MPSGEYCHRLDEVAYASRAMAAPLTFHPQHVGVRHLPTFNLLLKLRGLGGGIPGLPRLDKTRAGSRTQMRIRLRVATHEFLRMLFQLPCQPEPSFFGTLLCILFRNVHQDPVNRRVAGWCR